MGFRSATIVLTRPHSDLIHISFSGSWGFITFNFCDSILCIALSAGQPMFLPLWFRWFRWFYKVPYMRKILFVTYLTKSCLRVYISQLENTPLNVHKNRLKDSLTSGNSVFSFCKPAGQSRFRFLESGKQRRATTGPSSSFQPRRPASTLKRPWNRSDRPRNLDFPGLKAENTRLASLWNRLQWEPYSVSAGRGSSSFSSRAVPYIDHKSLVRLALPNQDPSAGPEKHPSGSYKLDGRSRRHLTASVTAWNTLMATDTWRPYVLKREGPYSSI